MHSFDRFNALTVLCFIIAISYSDEIATVHKQFPAEPFKFTEPR